MYKFNITDIDANEVLCSGDVGEIKHQMNQMLDKVATTPGARLYGNFIMYDPNQSVVQHVQTTLATPVSGEAQGTLVGSTITFETQTESDQAYGVALDALAGFYVDVLETNHTQIMHGYNEECQPLITLKGP